MNKIKLLSILSALCFVVSLSGQQIVLDSPVKAGPLTLFPDMEDPNTYYYLSDKPRLATTPDGKPQFSFLRFVDNAKTGVGAGSKSEGEGGGIVHAVVMLDVTPQERAQAEQELKRINSNGKIQGPVVYTGGTIALISSIAQPNGEFAKTVVGLGKAPILDGQRAAISVLLTKKGAKILRESFNTPTPDMSISFEMTISGFRKPKKAIIEANFDQVYEHKSFQAAVAAPILQAEINMAFDELVRSGAIKVINKGADAQMEALITDAYNKLTRMMFEPAGGTGTPGLDQLSGAFNNRPSLIDRASNMLNNARREAREENREIRADNERLRAEAERQPSGGNNTAGTGNPPATTTPPAIPGSTTTPATTPATGSDAAAGGEMRPGRSYGASEPRRGASEHARTVDPARPFNSAPAPRQEVSVPSIAIAASFEMRRVRQKGTYRIDLEKWSTDNLTMRFDGNFGQINCPECFRDINMDDPLYRQKEVTAFLDGSDAQDFGKYINFVSVMLRKKHDAGDLTEDEVRIDRNNFNQEGNNFSLMYGWKNDNNSRKWNEYEYKTVWNFFGGGATESAWVKTTNGTIPLAAPYVRTEILVEATPSILQDAGVRGVEIKAYYKVNDKEQVKQVKMNPRADQYTTAFDIITPRGNTEFEYELTWFMADGSAKNSGRLKSNNSMLYVDNITN